MVTCIDRRKGVTCQLGDVTPDGVHPAVSSPRHGGRDRRGVWRFWGTSMSASEIGRALADHTASHV